MQKLYIKLTTFSSSSFLPRPHCLHLSQHKKVVAEKIHFIKKKLSAMGERKWRFESEGGGKSFQQKPCDYANGHEQFETKHIFR